MARLIAAASRFLGGYLNRRMMLSHPVTERVDGNGKTRLWLQQYPVTSVTSLVINGILVPAASTPGVGITTLSRGYLLEPWDGIPPGSDQAIDLFHDVFRAGRQNVVINYQAGYLVSAEAQTVANGAVKVDAPYGPWANDHGVTYANGTPLTPVKTAPAAGQYQLTPDEPGSYAFNTSDDDAGILISYSFVPSDIAQACCELVGERFAYKSRIGVTSKSLGGAEVMAFSLKDIPDAMRLMLQPYMDVVPN